MRGQVQRYRPEGRPDREVEPVQKWGWGQAPDEHRYLHNVAVPNGNHDAKRAALDLDLAFDLRRPVKPRWPEFDMDLGGKPAGMPV
jgi:hypothetical protein